MEKSLAFFDSNVLIAASIPGHIHHQHSSARLATLQHGGGACAAHSLAEVYNTLTNDRKGYSVPPADAARILQHASKTYTFVALTAKETLQAIENIALQGLRGSIIYDALLLACARKIDAKAIYTNNIRHFRLIAPDLASRILLP
jgi:predicted nucleic acid-binding protein